MRLLLGFLLASLSFAASAAELRDVRVWSSPDGTRVVFDLSRATAHSLFTLDNPDRIVVDLDDTQRVSELAAQLDGKGVVKRIRSGAHDGTGLRVVLDLDGHVKSKSFSLQPNESYGYRVVVDLATEAQAAAAQVAAAAAVAPPTALPGSTPRPGTAPAQKPIVIAIDAGHGGEDPGTRGRRGLLEKEVCLTLARKLANQVNQEPGFKA